MSQSQPKGRSSLLDALDNSFLGMESSNSLAHALAHNLSQPQDNSLSDSSESYSPDTSAYFNTRELTNLMDVHVPSFNAGHVTRRDFNLNYDTEAPLKQIDIGGPDQEQRLIDFVTKEINNVSHGLTVKTAMEKLGLRDKQGLIAGLEVRLLAHQAIGVAWMVDQELGSSRGGILADDMGLGKTVQMIATMAMNMPKAEDEYQTTLIVVPAALLQQWKDEIETKTNGLFSVHIHHGKDKLKKSSDVKSYDIVITSYQTLHSDFGTPGDVEPAEEFNWLIQYGGPLARTKFYRVIADEAQFIRNRSTRASTSMAYVRSKYRWMLTGTPVTNSLADLYGLLRFGRFRPWNDWQSFNGHVARVQLSDALLAGTRAQAILKPILLRRTKNSEIEGVPILQLPEKHIDLVQLKFSEEERQIYDSFETRSRIQINKFIKDATIVKHHHFILVMILRLRQLCCHPNLILAQAAEFEDPTALMGGEGDKELARAKKEMGPTWVNMIKKRFLLRKAANEFTFLEDLDELPAASCCPNCHELLLADNGRVLSCGDEICFDCTLDLKNSPFYHDGIFGQGNEKQNLAVEKEYEMAQAKGLRPCPTCRKMVDLGPQKTFRFIGFEPSDRELDDYAHERREEKRKPYRKSREHIQKRSPIASSSKPKVEVKDILVLSDSDDDLPSYVPLKPPTKRQKQAHKASSDDKLESISSRKFTKTPTKQKANDVNDGPSDVTIRTWRKGDGDLVPSSKMVALVKFLQEWDHTGDKTIVYSQWTSMLDLIEILFDRHGIRSLRFDGQMDKAERDATLSRFKQPGGPKVILISTKCGSVGLNLVAANHVINMDLSWNYAAESQAYDRCHRIGQEKEVFVKRLVVENTIEERMLKLQDVKIGLADAALGEGTGVKLSKLSVKDIKYLFGMSKPKQNDAETPATL